MRFFSDGPNVPNELIDAQLRGEVVFFCGAGVSMPAGLPSFFKLTEEIIKSLGVPQTSSAYRLFARAAQEVDPNLSWPFDQIIGLLQRDYGAVAVEAQVAKHLRTPRNASINSHSALLRLSKNAAGQSRLITTNFDRLFEQAGGRRLKYFVPPVLPDLDMDHPFDGVVYLHGRLDPKAIRTRSHLGLILGAPDFGRAYLADGWATRFLTQILARQIVVLVGYSADDPPIRYLLEGLRSKGADRRRKVYAFVHSPSGSTDQRWIDRGVEVIPYLSSDVAHTSLWLTMEAWAARSEDPDAWTSNMLSLSRRGPTGLQPHERGQVASFAATLIGAKAFADAVDPPPPEWLCVFDASIRYAKPSSLSREEEKGIFDPLAEYGLDDDPPRDDTTPQVTPRWGVDILAAQSGDDRGADYRRLAGSFYDRATQLPPRLGHLSRWIARTAHTPTTVWWAARHHQLHHHLKNNIEWRLHHSEMPIQDIVKRAWLLLLEAQEAVPEEDRREWYTLKKAIKKDGWLPGHLRQLAILVQPQLVARRPIGSPRPPAILEPTRLSEIIDFDLVFPRLSDLEPDVPDDALPVFVAVVRRALEYASSVLHDISPVLHRLPTLIPEVLPGDRHIDDEAAYFLSYSRLLDRLRQLDVGALQSELAAWPRGDATYFAKLRTWLIQHPDVASASSVAAFLLSLSDEGFWNYRMTREILWTLRSRWSQMQQSERDALEKRLIAGPSRYQHENAEDYAERKSWDSATHLGWLEKNGCSISETGLAALRQLRASNPRWTEEADRHADSSHEGYGGWVRTDTDTSAISHLPASKVMAAIDAIERRPAGLLVERDPFLGLIKERLVKAIAVLRLEAKSGSWPVRQWQTLLSHWPEQVRSRASIVVFALLTRMPDEILVDLRFYAPRWIDSQMPALWTENKEFALGTWDHVFSTLSAKPEATESAMGEVTVGGVPQRRSRRTYGHALNSPIGQLVHALVACLAKQKPEKGSRIPAAIRDRFELALSTPGEGSDHAASMLLLDLRWFHFIDPAWTRAALLPLLDLDHPKAEPAWEAFLFANQLPSPSLFKLIKSAFLSALRVSTDWSWEDRATRRLGKFVVVAVASSWEGTKYITSNEARAALQSTDDEGRLGALDQVRSMLGDKHDWHSFGARFFREVWPKETTCQTSVTSRSLVDIAVAADDQFPDAIDAVLEFMRPTKNLDTLVYRWKRGREEDRPSIAEAFPQATIKSLSRLVEDDPAALPYDLDNILRVTAEADPMLRSTPEWRRLDDLSKRR